LNLTFQRLVDRYVGVPVCALVSLVERLRPARTQSAPRCILVIMLSEMGSLVLAWPMFAQLRQRYPDAALHVVLFARNREMLDLLRVVPEASVVTLEDRSLVRFVGSVLRALRSVRRLKPDVVIDCELFARVSSLFAYLSGAPTRVGFHRHTQEGLYRGSFINRPVLYNPHRHISRQFLTLAAAIGSIAFPPQKADPAGSLEVAAFEFDPGELERAAARLDADFPALRGRRLVLVYPGGGILPIRAWPFESYRVLCAALRDEGYAIGVTGPPADRPLGDALVAQLASPRCVNLTGYTRSIRHLLALFHRAALLVTNDGGPGQFSALTPIPTIVLFGPETPLLYGPLGANAYWFDRKLPCSPCLSAYNHRRSPCDGDNQCLKQITPNEVLAKARQMLAAQTDMVVGMSEMSEFNGSE